MMNLKRLGTITSIVLPTLALLLIINFIFELIPNSLQGLPIFLPLLVCPIGMLFAFLSYKVDKNNWSKFGMVLNAILFVTTSVWMIGGTIFFGV